MVLLLNAQALHLLRLLARIYSYRQTMIAKERIAEIFTLLLDSWITQFAVAAHRYFLDGSRLGQILF